MNIVEYYRELSRLYGVCPECGEVFRLFEAELFTNTPPPRTPFDMIERAQEKLERAEERFEEREAAIREAAQARGQALAKRRIARLAQRFTRRRLDPQDVKAIFSPVEYVAFRGLSAKKVTAVELIGTEARTRDQDRAHESLDRAIQVGNVEWKVFRLDENGAVVVED